VKRLGRVCLITPGNLASNPRVVKEASALEAAGYAVAIVAADIIPSLSVFDAAVLGGLKCKATRIEWRRPLWRRVLRALRQRLARLVAACITKPPLFIAAAAHHPLTPALRRAALKCRADLYIAHNLGALPAAAAAANRYGAKFGFDAEDYHCGQLDTINPDLIELRIRRSLESHLLPKCHYLTTSSPGIAAAYDADYGIRMDTILNVFPLSDAPGQPAAPAAREGRPQLYWFSQTIGPRRGLENVVRAMGRMQTRAVLHVRGDPVTEFVTELLGLALAVGGTELVSRIKMLEVAPPNQMVRLAASYDIGLAVEPGFNVNNDIALSNKIFTYLLAGIPVLLSKTKAQEQLSEILLDAAILSDVADPAVLADALDLFFLSERQASARATAWRLGRERFNWDLEKEKFLSIVEKTLSPLE
jgi:glycosyltransferase involved in cell wall biosynthesis